MLQSHVERVLLKVDGWKVDAGGAVYKPLDCHLLLFPYSMTCPSVHQIQKSSLWLVVILLERKQERDKDTPILPNRSPKQPYMVEIRKVVI